MTTIRPSQLDDAESIWTIYRATAAAPNGLARTLFVAMFDAAKSLTPAVTRFELMVREGNAHAIRLYERLGFKIEGRFEKRVRLDDGTLEDDVVMGRVISSRP